MLKKFKNKDFWRGFISALLLVVFLAVFKIGFVKAREFYLEQLDEARIQKIEKCRAYFYDNLVSGKNENIISKGCLGGEAQILWEYDDNKERTLWTLGRENPVYFTRANPGYKISFPASNDSWAEIRGKYGFVIGYLSIDLPDVAQD